MINYRLIREVAVETELDDIICYFIWAVVCELRGSHFYQIARKATVVLNILNRWPDMASTSLLVVTGYSSLIKQRFCLKYDLAQIFYRNIRPKNNSIVENWYVFVISTEMLYINWYIIYQITKLLIQYIIKNYPLLKKLVCNLYAVLVNSNDADCSYRCRAPEMHLVHFSRRRYTPCCFPVFGRKLYNI